MTLRSRLLLALLAGSALADSTIAIPLRAQTGATLPERAVRRDIPLTNIIRKAFAAGTRDSTGRPGKNYAQLRTDYTINATLDPSTSRITGRESIVISNNTADSLASIVMRLDQNLFLFQSPHLAPWIPSENTDGFVITKITVNGQPVNLAPVAGGRGGRGRGERTERGDAQSVASGACRRPRRRQCRQHARRPAPRGRNRSLAPDCDGRRAGRPARGAGAP